MNHMKIKGEYVLREIMGETVAVPIGETVVNSNVLVLLNETGTFFWNLLAKGASQGEIISSVCSEYETDEETVKADLEEFITYLKANNVDVE